jgi:hypothetical protein
MAEEQETEIGDCYLLAIFFRAVILRHKAESEGRD